MLVIRDQRIIASDATDLLKALRASLTGRTSMRILFNGVAHPTTLAKSLKRALSARGHEVGIRTCEQHVAGMTGYANWHELRSVSERRPQPSPTDRVAGPEVAQARRRQYVDFLARLYGTPTAAALVEAIRPTGSSGPAQGEDPFMARWPTVTGPDGLYPFVYAHKAVTDRGEMLVRSVGRVRIPSSGKGARPVFAGEFFLPRHSTIPRPATTQLELYAVEGVLYSRLEPVLHSPLPDHFGHADELQDTLLWRKQPAYGIAGHPMEQALNIWNPGQPAGLRDHVCPPDWDVDFHNGGRDLHYIHADLYSGSRSRRFGSDGEAMAFYDRLQAAGPPTIHDDAGLAAAGIKVLSSDRERVGRELAKAVDGSIAMVGDRVMLRTPEPCWRLTMVKGGDLRLDLLVSEHIAEGNSLEPTLFFALDEEEARDRAIEHLLASARRPKLRTRGELRSYEASACRIDGTATSLAYLAAGMREALHQASKVLPPEAALAAAALRTKFAPDLPTKITDFKRRDGRLAGMPDGVLEGWERLLDLAGDAITTGSDSPWLARLAGHGAVLCHLGDALPPAPACSGPGR